MAMKPGCRYDLLLTVLTVGAPYDARTLNGGERTVYPYRFRDAAGHVYAYSGNYLGTRMQPGREFKVRATCKRLEPRFRQTRLSRLTIEEVDEKELRLFG